MATNPPIPSNQAGKTRPSRPRSSWPTPAGKKKSRKQPADDMLMALSGEGDSEDQGTTHDPPPDDPEGGDTGEGGEGGEGEGDESQGGSQ